MNTPTNGPTKRDRLVDSAASLFHQKGMMATSLADIAKHAEIPIGNVYYYFKTKDELAQATLEKRKRAMQEICARLDEMLDEPRERLIQMARFFDKAKEEYAKNGCPVFRMITDGGEADGDAVSKAASQIYEDFVAWAEKQFKQLGHEASARELAVSLLAGIQGGAVMAKAFGSSKCLSDEIERLVKWLQSLPNKKIFLGKAGMVKKAETV